MTRRKKVLFLFTVGVAAVVLLLVVRWFGEPRYQGKSLSYWVQPWRYGGQESSESVARALEVMSDRAVPHLIKRLQWRPSRWKRELRQYLPNWAANISLLSDREDPRQSAAHALHLIGDAAAPAIPYLEAASAVNDTPKDWAVRVAAQAALIRIRREPLAPHIEPLRDTYTSDIPKWVERAIMIGYLGTNAATAVPILVKAMDKNHHEVMRGHAAIALGMVHSHPELCVSPLAEMLASPVVALRQKAIDSLRMFGRDAKPAWQAIVQSLNDSDPWVRFSATNALQKIDPDQAQRMGIQ